MSKLKLTLENASIKKEELMKYNKQVEEIHEKLNSMADKEDEFVGWLHLPTNYDKEEFQRIKKSAEKIKKDSEVFIVIGIGGSYLGARAVIEALTSTFYNINPNRKTPIGIDIGPKTHISAAIIAHTDI